MRPNYGGCTTIWKVFIPTLPFCGYGGNRIFIEMVSVQMSIYHLNSDHENVIGCFSRDHTPILEIDPGDTIVYQTLDAGWGLEPLSTFAKPRKKLTPREGDDQGHCVVGPVAIRGARAGMTLEIAIGAVRPGVHGYTLAGGWDHPVNRRLGVVEGGEHIHTWTLDADTLTGRDQHGHTIALAPFMGIMGVAPAEAGTHSTVPPRKWGGNLDCKLLTAGTSLFLPIGVDSGLFYVGDGHAVQGNGEVSVTAIECPMESVELTFHLHEEMSISMPRARCPQGWVTFGLDENLNEATFQAIEQMLDLLREEYHLERRMALALASLSVDLHITQIVNQVCGVHTVLPFAAITGWSG
ncbi:MAG: acetamidase/formamidase family protein [Chloroflexota bacterium]|nr:acetamidase/formamidase family protein [Chloroflexota bacterium]